VDEAAEYMSTFWQAKGIQGYYNTSNGLSTGSKLTAYTNWEQLADGKTISHEWLRTYARIAGGAGGGYIKDGTDPSYLYGAHPALWVTSDIFNP
jgi:hypothetical protein